MGLSWIDDLIDYTPLFALRMRLCCIRFTMGHGAELGKGRGAIPYQVDLGWYFDVMTLLSGRTFRGSILFFRSSQDLAGSCSRLQCLELPDSSVFSIVKTWCLSE